MEVTINVPTFLLYLLVGIKPIGEDQKEVIGDSRLAYLGEGHPFTQAARWHDQMYLKDYRKQKLQGMTRFQVDEQFLKAMLAYTFGKEELVREAIVLFLFVRQYGGAWFED